MERLNERIGCAWHSRSSVNLFLSISQCLACGRYSALFFCCLAVYRACELWCLRWEDFSLVSGARSPLSWLVIKLLTLGYDLQSGPVLGCRSSVPEFQACILQKSEPKSKEKWRNFLSGQNAIISPRATNLGRRSWFACACVINCICKWLSPYSGLKGRCWLSLAFDILLFSEHFHNILSRSFLIKSLWGPHGRN